MYFLTALIPISLVSVVHAAPVAFTQEIRISAAPEKVWAALTKPEIVRTYHMIPLLKMDLKSGGVVLYGREGKIMISGTITELEPNVKLAHTFHFGLKTKPTDTEGDTLVTYTLRKDGDATVLNLTHSGFTEKNETYTNATGGWPFILKKLKSTLEATPAG